MNLGRITWRHGQQLLVSALPPSARVRQYLFSAFALAACAIVLAVAQHVSRSLDYHAVVVALRGLPSGLVFRSLLLALLSYAALVGRDACALRYANIRLPTSTFLVGAIAGAALGNSAGFGALTGAAVRYRIYRTAGVKADQVARLTLLTNVVSSVGLVLLSAGATVVAAPAAGALLHLPVGLLRGLGCGAAGLSACFLLWCRRGGRPIRVWRFQLERPGAKLALLQLALTILDVVLAGASLWVLQPTLSVGFLPFIGLYAVALLLGIIGHTPGGIGVFDAAILLALGGTVEPSAAVAGLLAYRAIYFLFPLLLATALLVIFELRGLRGWVHRSADRVVSETGAVVPIFLGVMTFAVGTMLVLSGATPAFGHRLAVLQTILPLWLLESANLLASVIGVLLLFVTRGLFRRLDGAWWLAVSLAVLGAGFSLAKGLAFGETAVLGVFVLLLLLARRLFDRPASLLREPLTLSWIVAVGIVVAISVWILFFAFRNVPYSHDLWWQFEFNAKAPRALRATFAVAILASGIALWQLLRLAPGRVEGPTALDLQMAASIVRQQERSDAMLAIMGDKSFLFSRSGEAFLMYRKRGRSWVALGDPVGPREDWSELVSRFMELADAHGGRAAFYQVRADGLALYLNAGLRLVKLGEEARIPLASFKLDGSQRAGLRYALRRGERDGLSFEVIEPDRVGPMLPTLRQIAESWTESRRSREKGFSVAGFKPEFVATQTVVLVRQGGTPVAFATVMTTDCRTEATVGVMRHLPDASAYAMEYLFTRLALHLKELSFSSLSLGMAPLSGLVPTPLASVWHRIAYLIWRHGERLYKFRGLRAFKSKFGPTWEPRYLAASGAVGPLVTLAEVALITQASWT